MKTVDKEQILVTDSFISHYSFRRSVLRDVTPLTTSHLECYPGGTQRFHSKIYLIFDQFTKYLDDLMLFSLHIVSENLGRYLV